ncbi:Uncharacterized protein APZ42_019054 [Daphnia magna]|uniref:Uncharacterized protein n=1 Tax=Daphnia magna TaxID=35525 RepID=A0A162CFU5_9CRUS|nr:Uncharacterized protein APZ42_019054 [Daphnia magna]
MISAQELTYSLMAGMNSARLKSDGSIRVGGLGVDLIERNGPRCGCYTQHAQKTPLTCMISIFV